MCPVFSIIATGDGLYTSNHKGCNMRFISTQSHKLTTSKLTSHAQSNLIVISSCQQWMHKRWWGQIWHGANKGGGEMITVDYFRVGNSTWSHAAGAPTDLGKNRIGLQRRFAHLWLTDLVTWTLTWAHLDRVWKLWLYLQVPKWVKWLLKWTQVNSSDLNPVSKV